MVIVCSSCATEYTIEPARVGPKGRDVRCGHCRTSWFVAPQQDTPGSGRADEIAPTAIPNDAGRGRSAVAADQRPRPTRGQSRDPRASLATRAFVAAIAIALAMVAFRSPIVRAVPKIGTLFAALGLPVNLVGLTLEDVSSNVAEEGGRPVLVAVGRIANATRRDLTVPDLEITLMGGRGDALYHWAMKPPSSEIASGEARRFSVRLASPPPDALRLRIALRNAPDGEAVASRP